MRLDKIRNVDIRGKVEVMPIDYKMRKAKLRSFGHIKRRSMDVPMRRCEKIDLSGCRGVKIDRERVGTK